MGVAREESVEFPVWYEPQLGAKAPQIAAFEHCRGLLQRWTAEAGANPGVPLVVHVSSGASGDGNPQVAVSKLMELATPAGPPLLLQAHLAASAAAAATSLYPSNYVYLTLGSARDLFRRASLLPPHLVEALRDANTAVNSGARGLIYNAKISDVIRLFGLVKPNARLAVEGRRALDDPVSSAGALPRLSPILRALGRRSDDSLERTAARRRARGIVVLVLDRSAADPFSGAMQMPFFKLQDQANDVLKQISKLGDLAVDAAIVSYGLGAAGEPEDPHDVRRAAGRSNRRALWRLGRGRDPRRAIRRATFQRRRRPGDGRSQEADLFRSGADDRRPAPSGLRGGRPHRRRLVLATSLGTAAPVVLHLTRGYFDPAEIEQAAAALAEVRTSAGPVTLYHWVATETPHKSLDLSGRR